MEDAAARAMLAPIQRVPSPGQCPSMGTYTSDEDGGSWSEDESTQRRTCAKREQEGEEEEIPSTSSASPCNSNYNSILVEVRRPPQQNREPRDFVFVKIIGEGAYSTVYQAREVKTGSEYAIKVVTKAHIQRNKKVQSIMREKNIMAMLTYGFGCHPFVVSLYCTFQDADRLYFAMSYCPRGDMQTTLQRVGCFDKDITRFYSAEMVEALRYIHEHGVTHRDLKPENILFKENGHICITDFGSAKVVGKKKVEDVPATAEDGKEEEKKEEDIKEKLVEAQNDTIQDGVVVDDNDCSEATRRREESDEDSGSENEEERHNRKRLATFVGTAQYVSPEMLAGGEVGIECDYWALGAIIYQMLSGSPPFRAVNDYHLMKKIQQLDFYFPPGFPIEPLGLVKQLLVLDPKKRLGSPDIGRVEAHPFYENVNFANLNEQHPPEIHPYVPASMGEPEFYSQLTVEPGLDDKAITRLMMISMSGGGGEMRSTSPQQHSQYSISPNLSLDENMLKYVLPGTENLPSIRKADLERQQEKIRAMREAKMEKQKAENSFHKFVEENLILKQGFVDKKKGLFARRRMFLLTEGPHIYYVDPVNMVYKGEIPFGHTTQTEVKNFRTFFVHTPDRTYYLFDPERRAVDWCEAIDKVRNRYFPAPPPEPAKEIEVVAPTPKRVLAEWVHPQGRLQQWLKMMRMPSPPFMRKKTLTKEDKERMKDDKQRTKEEKHKEKEEREAIKARDREEKAEKRKKEKAEKRLGSPPKTS